MPSWVKHIAALCIALSLPANAVGAPSAERQDELLNLLKQDCGSCHGMTMKGGLGPSLLPQAIEGKPDAFLVRTVLEGRPDTAMPPWQGLLSHDEVHWLIQQLRRGLNHE